MKIFPYPILLVALLFLTGVALPGEADAARARTAKSSKSASAKSSKSEKKSTARNTHTVRKGESLYTIARANGMKVATLKRLNGLRSDKLKPGQVLVLSAPKAKAPVVAASDTAETATTAIMAGTSEQEPDETAPVEGRELFHGEAGIQSVARSFLAIPYRFGAESRKATDCSGFVQQVFREFDIRLPRTAREQYRVGSKVPKTELQSGDLVFFRTYARYPSHVGIYLGNGKMIHASRYNRKVVISDVNHPYFTKRYLGAKRVAMFLPGDIDVAALTQQVEEINDEAILEGEAPDAQEPEPGSENAPVPQEDEEAVQTAAGEDAPVPPAYTEEEPIIPVETRTALLMAAAGETEDVRPPAVEAPR